MTDNGCDCPEQTFDRYDPSTGTNVCQSCPLNSDYNEYENRCKCHSGYSTFTTTNGLEYCQPDSCPGDQHIEWQGEEGVCVCNDPNAYLSDDGQCIFCPARDRNFLFFEKPSL